MQENWIGKSEGVRFAFTHTASPMRSRARKPRWYRAAACMCSPLAPTPSWASPSAPSLPEHPLATLAANATIPGWPTFIEQCKKGGTSPKPNWRLREKEGRPPDCSCTIRSPAKSPVPVWIGNYVLMSYGDGAVMGVPAHDERDFEFANKYGLPMVQVSRCGITQSHGETAFTTARWQDWYGDKQRGVSINSGKYDGLDVQGTRSTPWLPIW